jgi:oligoendopeptidase F
MAHKLGYPSYTELGYIRMSRYDYTPEMVAAYREQIKEEVTPLAAKILKAQFKRTGIKNPEIYDLALTFKDGNPLPLGTTAEKIAHAQKMYDELSPETSYFFKYMVDHHVLDLEAKPGKQSGGYMTYFPKYKIPFIFSNFNGTSGRRRCFDSRIRPQFPGLYGPEHQDSGIPGSDDGKLRDRFDVDGVLRRAVDEPLLR